MATTPRRTEIATEFLTLAAAGRVREAFDRHVAEPFSHHNAYFPGDRASLLEAMEQSALHEPNKSFVVKQVIDGGDRVVVLSQLRRPQVDQAYAVVHILRFEEEGSKIVEMWDIGQEIPKDSPNERAMF